MFFKKNLEVKPLGYWEKESIFLVISKGNQENVFHDLIDNLTKDGEFSIIEQELLWESQTLKLKLKYQSQEYDVSFRNIDFTLPRMYHPSKPVYNDEEIKELNEAYKALMIAMKFGKNVKEDYLAQVKIAVKADPNIVALVDESAERLRSGSWAKMLANSKVLPSCIDLYNVHIVNEKDQTWLHTHGLCRLGLTELEILNSNKENSYAHYNLLVNYANYLLEYNSETMEKSSSFIGLLSNQMPIVVTSRPWNEALKYYKNLKIGNIKDRKESHNSLSNVVFLYTSPENEKQGVVDDINVYNQYLSNNPLYFISDDETLRMSALAREKFNILKEIYQKDNVEISIKIGLKVDDSDDLEHIWYELETFDQERFKAKLLQEPYNVSNKHIGDEDWFTIDNVTDWLITIGNYSLSPSDIYMLPNILPDFVNK